MTPKYRTLLVRFALAVLVVSSVVVVELVFNGKRNESLIGRSVGSELSKSDTDWALLDDLIAKSFPGKRESKEVDRNFQVWQTGSEYLVLANDADVTTHNSKSVHFFWLDRSSKPIDSYSFLARPNESYRHCILVPLPGTSFFALETGFMDGPNDLEAQVSFGLDGHQPVFIRYSDQSGQLVSFDFHLPHDSRGPYAITYQKVRLEGDLNETNPVRVLKALNWLNGLHTSLGSNLDATGQIDPDAVEFAELSSDQDIKKAVLLLQTSSVSWISQAAKYFIVSHPLSVPPGPRTNR